MPQREIGVDADARVLFAAPDSQNFGFWTNGSMRVGAGDLTPMTAADFERLWALTASGRA